MRKAGSRGGIACLIALLALLSMPTTQSLFANEALPEAADPVLETRMLGIASELRCLVCQNQTIADSHADLAQDLRRQVREQLKQGRSDREIIDYMTARYGDFVLYRPPFKAITALLWLGPALMLAIGAAVLLLVLRRRNRLPAAAFETDAFESDAFEPGGVEPGGVEPGGVDPVGLESEVLEPGHDAVREGPRNQPR